jgi:hypothetical protein
MGIGVDPLVHDPRSFREMVEADLRRAARLVIKVQDEIDPQLRVASRGLAHHVLPGTANFIARY